MITASLAPMAGFTDCSFRRLASRYGVAYTVSEMISAVALTMRDKKTATLARIVDGEAPVVLQIFGHDPDIMARAADILLSGSFDGCEYAAPPIGIDINMGCPVKKIVSNGEGSALARDFDLSARVTSAVREVCDKYSVPLSVKIRTGWDADHITAPMLAPILARAGASKITLHTRTREQMYAPSADPEICREVRDALDSAGYADVILCGNGDIDSVEAAERYISLGCDEVAIGRAALGAPWLFAALRAPDSFTPPTTDEIISTAAGFVRDVVSDLGEEMGILESRGRAAHFIKGMRGSASIRDRLNRATTLNEFLAVLADVGKD